MAISLSNDVDAIKSVGGILAPDRDGNLKLTIYRRPLSATGLTAVGKQLPSFTFVAELQVSKRLRPFITKFELDTGGLAVI